MARDQHVGRDVELERPETAPTGDVRQRLAGRPPRDGVAKRVRRGGIDVGVAPSEEPRARPTERVHEQELGFAPRFAAGQRLRRFEQQRIDRVAAHAPETGGTSAAGAGAGVAGGFPRQ